MNTDLDQQIRRLADIAFAQTDPVTVPLHPRRTARRWLAVAAGLLVLLMTVALVSIRSNPDEIEPVDFSTGLSVGGVFAEVPLSELARATQVTVNAVDFDEVAGLTGIERAGLGDPDDDWTPVLLCGALDCDATSIVAVPLGGDLLPQAFRSPEEFELQLGWTDADIAAIVSWEVLTERGAPTFFDLFRLDSDLAPLVERAGADAIVDLGSGNDFEVNFDDTSELRMTGVPLHIGVDPARSITAVSQSTAAVTSWLDGEGDSAADDAVAGELARALDGTGDIYAFEATFGNFRLPADRIDEITEALGFTADDILISEPISALGVGWSGIGDTRRTTIAYVFDSAAAAADSVDAIAELYAADADFVAAEFTGQWPTMGSILDVDNVSASGRTVTVAGRAASGAGPIDVLPGLTRPSPLSLHR